MSEALGRAGRAGVSCADAMRQLGRLASVSLISFIKKRGVRRLRPVDGMHWNYQTQKYLSGFKNG